MMTQENIYPVTTLSRASREELLGQRSLMIWFTGLSGSGKSTLALALEERLSREGKICRVLDGDNIRTGINNNLGFSIEDRQENIRRIAEVSKLFVDTGIITIAAFISPTRQIRALARDIIGADDFFEIYVNTPLEVCEQRDVKGLYKKARAGLINHNLDAPLLLGQSAIQKLGPIQLDGNKLIIQNGKSFKSDKQARDLYDKSFQDIEAKNYEDAILNLNKALECAVDKKLKSLLYSELAIAYYHSNKKELAIECCHKGLGENPMNEQLGYNLGVYLYEMGEIRQAEKAFNQQISKFENIVPNNKNMRAATYSYLAEIQYNNGEYINAETNYQKSLNISANSAAYLGLGDVFSTQKQYIKAAENYEKGIAYEPDRLSNIKRYNQLGLAYFYAEQYEKAYNAFLNCISTMNYYKELFETKMQSNDKEIKDLYLSFMSDAMNSKLWIARLAKTPHTVAGAQDLNGTDVGIVRGEIGVAENGCVWIPQTMKERAVCFISEYLVILLSRKCIVSNMHQAYGMIRFTDYGYGSFISGPSKTADIAQALVMGAQAARGVTVILTD